MSREVRSEDELYALLHELGGSLDEVAETLRAGGFAGEQLSAESCPVAKWLMAETDLLDVSVDTGAFGICGRPPGGDLLFAEAPSSVETFIVDFDQGEYPDLEVPTDGAS